MRYFGDLKVSEQQEMLMLALILLVVTALITVAILIANNSKQLKYYRIMYKVDGVRYHDVKHTYSKAQAKALFDFTHAVYSDLIIIDGTTTIDKFYERFL